MNTTQDIDTSATAPALTITDLKQLTEVIHDMAQTQLLLNRAEADMQSRIEVIKKAYDEATAELVEKIKTALAAVEAYATKHKDALFPIKGGKRKKTLAILQHALKFRESSSVEVPDDAVQLINTLICNHEWELQREQMRGAEGDVAIINTLAETITALKSLIRKPDPELNKDAVKSLKNEAAQKDISRVGIKIVSSETFKVEFTFTPETQQAAA